MQFSELILPKQHLATGFPIVILPLSHYDTQRIHHGHCSTLVTLTQCKAEPLNHTNGHDVLAVHPLSIRTLLFFLFIFSILFELQDMGQKRTTGDLHTKIKKKKKTGESS